MGDRLYDMICRATADYTHKTGDTRIATVHIPEQKVEDGWHPLPKSHIMAAEVVADAIARQLGGQV